MIRTKDDKNTDEGNKEWWGQKKNIITFIRNKDPGFIQVHWSSIGWQNHETENLLRKKHMKNVIKLIITLGLKTVVLIVFCTLLAQTRTNFPVIQTNIFGKNI